MSKSVAILAATASLLIGVAVYYLVASKKKKKGDEDARKINGFLPKANITLKPPSTDDVTKPATDVSKPADDVTKAAAKTGNVFELRRGHDVEWIDVQAQKKFEFGGVVDENLDKIVSSLITESAEESDMTQSVAESFASLIGEGPEACLVRDVQPAPLVSAAELSVHHQEPEIKKHEVTKKQEVATVQTHEQEDTKEIEEPEVVNVIRKPEVGAAVQKDEPKPEVSKEIEKPAAEVKKLEAEAEVVKVEQEDVNAKPEVAKVEPEVAKTEFAKAADPKVEEATSPEKADSSVASLMNGSDSFETAAEGSSTNSLPKSPNANEAPPGGDAVVQLSSTSFEQISCDTFPELVSLSSFEPISLPQESFEHVEAASAASTDSSFEQKFERKHKTSNSSDDQSDKNVSTFSEQILESGASSMVADAIVDQIVENVFVATPTVSGGEEEAEKLLKVTETVESFTSGLVDSPKSSDLTWVADDENGNFSDRSDTMSDDDNDNQEEEDEPVWNHSVSGKTSAPEKPLRKKLAGDVLKEESEEDEEGEGEGRQLETSTEF